MLFLQMTPKMNYIVPVRKMLLLVHIKMKETKLFLGPAHQNQNSLYLQLATNILDQIITLKFAILRCKCLKLDDHFYQLLSKYYYRPQLVISPSATVNSPVSFHKSPKHWVLIAGVAIVGCYLEKRKENYKYMNVLTSIIPMWRAETIIG